ncbi:unnamed protein product [Cunninghamella blakesleeana]
MTASSRDRLYTQNKGYGFTPALQRTRKPFAKRNVLTLGGLLTFTTSVYDFSDVPLPSQLPGVHDVTKQEREKAAAEKQ